MVTNEFAIRPIHPGTTDDSRFFIELKVDQRRSTGDTLLVEIPEPGPVGLNPQTWLPRIGTVHVGAGEHFGCEVYSVPAKVYRKICAALTPTA